MTLGVPKDGVVEAVSVGCDDADADGGCDCGDGRGGRTSGGEVGFRRRASTFSLYAARSSSTLPWPSLLDTFSVASRVPKMDLRKHCRQTARFSLTVSLLGQAGHDISQSLDPSPHESLRSAHHAHAPSAVVSIEREISL